MNDGGIWCMVAGLLTGTAFFFGVWVAIVVAALRGKRSDEREYTYWERVARKEELDPRTGQLHTGFGSPVRCEHRIKDGDWCEACNREYKLARRQYKQGLDDAAVTPRRNGQ